MAPEQDNAETRAAVEASVAKRARQREEGRRIARQMLGEETPTEEPEVLRMLRDLDDETLRPEERDQRASLLAGQEAGAGNWHIAEAALKRIHDVASRETTLTHFQGRAIEQGDEERVTRYATMREEAAHEREVLGRIVRKRKPETKAAAVIVAATDALRSGNNRLTEKAIELLPETFDIDSVRKGIAESLVQDPQLREVLPEFIGRIEDEEMRKELFAQFIELHPEVAHGRTKKDQEEAAVIPELKLDPRSPLFWDEVKEAAKIMGHAWTVGLALRLAHLTERGAQSRQNVSANAKKRGKTVGWLLAGFFVLLPLWLLQKGGEIGYNKFKKHIPSAWREAISDRLVHAGQRKERR